MMMMMITIIIIIITIIITSNKRDNWNCLRIIQKIPEQRSGKARSQGTT